MLLLTIHVIVASLVAALPAYTYRHLGFRFEHSRFNREHLRSLTLPRLFSAAAVTIGLALSLVSITPAIALAHQMSGDAPPVDGWSSVVTPPKSPFSTALFSNSGPVSHIRYVPDRYESPVGTITDEQLQGLYADGWIPALEVLVPNEDPSSLVPDPSNFTPDAVRFDLWADSVNEPLVLRTTNSETANVTIGPLNQTSFERNSSLRDLGISLVVGGALALWSETGITRFTFGPKPWVRRSPRRERFGWLLCAGAASVLAAVALLPLLFALDPPGSYLAYLFGCVVMAYIGMHIVTPAPPLKSPPRSEEQQAGLPDTPST